MNNSQIREKVQAAIAQGKIRQDQAAWAINYATKDPASFEVFINKVQPLPSIPKAPQESTIDETQRMINSLFGIDDETFKKYSSSRNEADQTGQEDLNAIDETQRMINKICGVDDETFKKYRPTN